MSDLKIQPGPCISCGATNYPLSMGGPGICSRCDCGYTHDPAIEKSLREALSQAQATIHNLGGERVAMLPHLAEAFRLLKGWLDAESEPRHAPPNLMSRTDKWIADFPFISILPNPDNPADDPNQCLACLGESIQHTCVPLKPEYICVRKEDLQKIMERYNGMAIFEVLHTGPQQRMPDLAEAYDRLAAALKEKDDDRISRM